MWQLFKEPFIRVHGFNSVSIPNISIISVVIFNEQAPYEKQKFSGKPIKCKDIQLFHFTLTSHHLPLIINRIDFNFEVKIYYALKGKFSSGLWVGRQPRKMGIFLSPLCVVSYYISSGITEEVAQERNVWVPLGRGRVLLPGRPIQQHWKCQVIPSDKHRQVVFAMQLLWNASPTHYSTKANPSCSKCKYQSDLGLLHLTLPVCT